MVVGRTPAGHLSEQTCHRRYLPEAAHHTDTVRYSSSFIRVPTFTGKPGRMRVHLKNLKKLWNFAKNNKNHGKITWNLEKYLGRL